MLNVFHAKKILCFKDSFSKLALLASMDYTYIYIFYIFLYFFTFLPLLLHCSVSWPITATSQSAVSYVTNCKNVCCTRILAPLRVV